VTFDIIRRILADYFKYNVFYVLNITDLDDKIIIRSRRNHLLKLYAAEAIDVEQVEKDITVAFTAALAVQTTKADTAHLTWKESEQKKTRFAGDNRQAFEEELAKLEAILIEECVFKAELLKQRASSAPGDVKVKALVAVGKGALGEWLDAAKGAEVTDHSIFKAHAAFYEKEFMEDMRSLGVRDPDALTRVTEYMEHIIDYVKCIASKGFAYPDGEGNVYFDTAAFTAKGYSYAKLSPWSIGNSTLTQSGEGALSASSSSSGRKCGMDFALWKASKKGEPSWDSPWGKGRPGWHIECSAMGSDLLGATFDVHSGGIDLKFPHHDNEIAQSESHGLACNQNWANHFWHAGHLQIAGMKMGKALKNFITIRDVLRQHSGRVVRYLFLMAPWDATMNYSNESLEAAAAREREFNEFFCNTAVAMRAHARREGVTPLLWNDVDREMHKKLILTRNAVDAALKANFNYPKAMDALTALVHDTNKYRLTPANKALILSQISRYVDSILRMFGVVSDPEPGGFEGMRGADGGRLEATLDAVASFRDAIRNGARAKQSPAELLALCDTFRDETMSSLGVRLEDVPSSSVGGPASSVWKLDDPVKLLRELAEKRRGERTKLQNKLEKVTRDLNKAAESSQSPRDYFSTLSSQYKTFDAEGCPLTDDQGRELTKSALKTIRKVWNSKELAHKVYTSKLEQDPNFVGALEQEQMNLELEIFKVDDALTTDDDE
jgi:cysteinyl-tRNA synthetase